MPALLFGSISTLADTSEEQRAAVNLAFERHGVDWQWERDDYRQLLAGDGGAARIAEFARRRNQDVDAGAVHATTSEIFRRTLHTVPLRPRPGVAESIDAARAQGWQVGLVTTTAPDDVTGLLDALDGYVSRDAFDIIVDATSVDEPKPSPAAYVFALEALGLDAGECVAVEDNVGGARSAGDAGIACVAFPNENTVEHDFGPVAVSHHLEFVELAAAVASR